jgi:hypothetical protein
VPVHEIAQFERTAIANVGRGSRLNWSRNLIDRQIGSGKRRRPSDIYSASDAR